MGLRERWNELETGGKLAVGLAVLVVGGIAAIVAVLVLSAVLASFVLGTGTDTGGSTSAVPPTASFTTDYYADNGTAKVIYEAGETLDAQRLSVVVDGQRSAWEDDDGEVTAGDSTFVEAESDSEVRLLWEGDDELVTLWEGSVEPPANGDLRTALGA